MNLKCECGGALRKATLRDYDFSPLSGLPVRLVEVAGYRCTRCKGETLDGAAIEHHLDVLTAEVLKVDRLLLPDEARYLRKRLGLSQKELAERMRVVRETVAAWECGQKALSEQHEYILRSLVFHHERGMSAGAVDAIRDTLSHVGREPLVAREPAPRYEIRDAGLVLKKEKDEGGKDE